MEKIHLKHGGSHAVIQTRGAEMISFKGSNGREIIWQGDPELWEQHAPILFPVCGTPKGRQVMIDNVAYPMMPHGFAMNSEFSIDQIGEDFVDLVLTPNQDTYSHYPFDFAFHVVYTLRENGFRADFIVQNRSGSVMPFCIGGHPGFIIPMEEGASFTDYQLVFPQKESGLNLLVSDALLIDGEEVLPLINGTTLPLQRALFAERDTLLFSEYKSRSVNLVHKDSGRGIRLCYPDMEVLAVWAMPEENGNFICLEPWHGLPGLIKESGKFEEKPFVTLLQPAMSHQCGYDVALI